jgi:2-oxoglutarate dehydrogenase E1 component
MAKAQAKEKSAGGGRERERIFDLFRRWGYLEARLDPLGHFAPSPHPELAALSGPDADEARRCYCGTIGVQFAHIADPARRAWIAERIERPAAAPDAQQRRRILARLASAELFEQILQTRYLGTKRYSLEGNAALVPLLDELIEAGAEHGAVQAVISMSHRGRLTVIVHTAGRSAHEVFAKFEDLDPRSVLGSGDVKYHLGATGEFVTRNGKRVNIHLVSNPSHLEAVDPVTVGRTRAKQKRLGKDGHEGVFPIILHGDAAFAGQGIWAETLNMAHLYGYSAGGTVHVIVNNLIGFTTNPSESHSSLFSADLARRLPIPIFHVNAEDPEAVVRVARIALDYRYEFRNDVVLDLIGYRRHGHSEVDDPTITQPRLYAIIQDHPAAYEIYARRIGAEAQAVVERIKSDFDRAWDEAKKLQHKPKIATLPPYWREYFGGPYKPEYEVQTGVAAEKLREIGEGLTRYPEGFHIHAKVKRLLDDRLKMARGERALDYGMAEALAFGSLLVEGIPIRLSGQDSRRGTFNQRHAVLIDTETEKEHIPLQHLAPGQARAELLNSPLSEAAVLGFEYGYSRDYPEALVLWEAQFGDFANAAQIIMDQFIAAGEDKWGLLSGLVMLLPHGYEGQGPEHSSARIERYLQLAAEDNMQICQPSTAGQYFHLLRRQALRRWRKPLVVFTPKSMLRHPDASSPLTELSGPRFLNVIPDESAVNAHRVLVATGKILHELRRERKRREDAATAIVALEQMYPFPETELRDAVLRYDGLREIVWVQEEPANMGALFYVQPLLERLAAGRCHVRSIKRSASASPATGSSKAHELEQRTLLQLAFALPPPGSPGESASVVVRD